MANGHRFMAASKVLGEETVAGSASQQRQQQEGQGQRDGQSQDRSTMSQ